MVKKNLENSNSSSTNEKDEDYTLAKELMTFGRFCGLLQSDGHFTITYDKKKVQNPKIILTQSNFSWLLGIKDWLMEKGINSSLGKKVTDSRGINLTIDRADCRRLISWIEEEETIQKTPLLFDNKRVNYLVLKESIRIKQCSNQKFLTKDEAAMLVDLKESGLKRGNSRAKGLTRNQPIERFGFPKMETKGSSDWLIKEINQKVERVGAEALNTILSGELKSGLAEFIAGVFDGDGSFTVGLFTHLNKDGKKLANRHTFEIVPAINVTTEFEKQAYLLRIINAAFGKKRQITLEKVNKKGKTIRLVIKSAKALKKFVVPFFEKYEPSLKKNRIRFEVFREVLKELPLNYQNKQKVLEMVHEIYDKDLYERSKPLSVFLKIVELDYN